MSERMMAGMKGPSLALVGADPGAHDLVTVRGWRLLQAAQVVCHPPGMSAALVGQAPLGAERVVVLDLARGLSLVGDYLHRGWRVVWLVEGAGEDARAALLARGDFQTLLQATGASWIFLPGVRAERVVARGPLAGKRVLVTRARHQARETCQALEALGASALAMPTIAIAPGEAEETGRAIEKLGRYDRLVLTSANAVDVLGDALGRAELDARALAGVTVCAIGPATAAALARIGLRADLVAREYRAEGLLDLLPSDVVSGERILLFRAKEAREVLPETLRERGAIVDVVAAYTTIRPPQAEVAFGLAALDAGEIDAVLFTSASTALHFAEIVGPRLGPRLEGVAVAAIGPVTAGACRDLGMEVAVIAREFTVNALIDALVAHYQAG